MKRIYYLFIALLILSACQREEEIPLQQPGTDPAVAPEATVLKGHVQVKFKRSAVSQVNVVKTRSGLSSGISAVDLAGMNLNVTRMERVFPYAGKFEERHKEAGLDLWYDVYFDESVPTSRAIGAYSNLPEIEIVSPVHEARLCDYQEVGAPRETLYSVLQGVRTKAAAGEEALPFNDPRLGEMWHYHNTGESVNGLVGALPGADIGVFEAWKTETGSPEVIVAVVDGGIQYNHPDLAANMWINEAELNGQPGVDDDGNGYVDDIYGWNFVTAKAETSGGQTIRKEGAITPYVHGTHCAGTISAVNGNGIGICGIAGGSGAGDGVRLMSCQIFHTDPATGESKGNADPNAFVYSADMGAVISSNSWTSGAYEESAFMNSAMRSAIDYFIKYAGKDPSTKQQVGPMDGGLVIFAAANSNSDAKEWPAAYSKVITVASMAHNFKKASYSNFGSWIDITAPGGEQSYGDNYAILSTSINNGYAWLQGTSMACPHMSGCAALVLSKFQGTGYTPGELWDRLINSAHNIDVYNQKYQGLLGSGYIDVGLALTPPSTEAPETSDLTIVDAYDGWAIVEWVVKAAGDGPMSKYVISWSTSPLQPQAADAAVQTRTVSVRNIAAGTVVREKIEGLEVGQEYYFSIRAYDRWGGVSEDAPQVSRTVTENLPPVLIPAWKGAVMLDEGTERTVSLKVNDPEKQNITCKIQPALPWINVQNVGDSVVNFRISPDYTAAGNYDVAMQVTDQYGKSTLSDMRIEVVYKEVAPRMVKSFADMQLAKNGRRTTLNLAEYFTDPKGRILIYEIENSSNVVANVQRAGDNLMIEPKLVGHTEIMVRAKSDAGLSVSQRFSVEVIMGDEASVEDALGVYPNPVKKDLNITLQPSVRGEVTLKLYNAAGRLMKIEKVTIGETGYSLDMSNMQAGTYVLAVEGAVGSWKKNIIKI